MLHSQKEFIPLLSIFFCSANLLGANVLTSAQLIAAGYALSICLTKDEVRELTLKTHHIAQARVLMEMGIRFTRRPDGSPVVLHAVLKTLDSNHEQVSREPDFSSLDP